MSVLRTASKKLESAKSLASSFQTDPTDIKYMHNVGYTIACSGVTSNTGEFKVEARIKESETSYSDWMELEFSTPIQLTNADKDIIINLNQLPFSQVRLTFTDSAGDGVCDIFVSAKGIGG